MNSEEKILEMLTQINDRMDQMSGRMDQIQDTQQKQGETLSDLQKNVTRVALTQENIVLKSLDALAEGQDLTHQRLKDLAGKDELAELRDEVRLMRAVIAQHSKDIEALKAAQ